MWSEILSDSRFRSLTSEVSSTGTPCCGDGGPIAAQQRRQIGGVGEPGARRRRRREHPPAQVRHGHHLPLQTLGGVHGEDLDAVVRDRHLGGRQAVLDVCRRRPETPADPAPMPRAGPAKSATTSANASSCSVPPQPAAAGRAARTSVSTPSTRRTSATRSGSGCVEMGAQRRQLAAQRDDPAVTVRRVRRGGSGIADRVGQAGGVGVGGGQRHDPLGRGRSCAGRRRRVRRRGATARRCRGRPAATAGR